MPQNPLLAKSRICLLGFGAQGEAEATNLRKSGVSFCLGLRDPRSSSAEKAKRAGFTPLSIEAALEGADSVLMNLPDQAQAAVYRAHIENRKSIRRLIFAHGFNTHFKLIPTSASGPQHILIAPKGAASGLIEFYKTENALPAILATQPSAPAAEEKLWIEELALAMGAHPKGLIWADFKDETVCDLFSEQALLCGGVSQLLRTAYDVMVEAGYNPDTAYFESLFELKLIVDLIWKQGITGMRAKISPTARYGDVTRGPRVIDETVKKKMQAVLKEIESGEFAKEFLSQLESAEFKKLEVSQASHPIETKGKILREKLHQ